MKKSFVKPKWEDTGLRRYRFGQLKDFFVNQTVIGAGALAEMVSLSGCMRESQKLQGIQTVQSLY